MREVIISPLDENQRVNKFLKKYLNKASESFIYKMLRKKNIKLNGGRINGNEILKAGDVLNIYISEDSLRNFMEAKEISEKAGGLRVVYEDENILICDKPAGILSQKESADDTDTMVDRIALYLSNKGEYEATADSAFSPSLCNRLDRNTGGLVLCGKNFAAAQSLNELIREKNIQKFYLALVKGKIKCPGGLHSYHFKNTATNEVKILERKADNVKEVLMEYRPIRTGGGYTFLEAELVTGKTHQIRAQLSAAGRPIAGDRKYGDPEVNAFFKKKFSINYQILYAHRVVFGKNGGFLEYLSGFECSAPLPDKLKKAIDRVFCDDL